MTISTERREELTMELDCADQMGDAAGPEIWVFRHELRTLLHDSTRLERIERQVRELANEWLERVQVADGRTDYHECVDELQAIVDTGRGGEQPGCYGTDLDEFEHKNGV